MECAAAARDTRQQVVVLSWLAKAYLKLRDSGGCESALARIRALRASTRPRAGNDAGVAASRRKGGVPHVSTSTGSAAGGGPSSGGGVLGSCLVLHCAQPDESNLDLGGMAARGLVCARRFCEALNTLAPTIVSVESAVSQTHGPRDGLVELGRLYKLRARIQQQLASTEDRPLFPVSVALGQQPAESESETAEPSPPPRWDDAPSTDVETGATGVAATTRRHYRSYNSPEDLLWDAQRWYRRSWECFRASGDRGRVAKVAIELSTLQLQCVFVPVVFSHVPLDIALGQDSAVGSPSATASARAPTARRITLDSIEHAMMHALDTANRVAAPMLLLEAYLNMAELRKLQQDDFAARAFWWEARDLFLHLFVDGASVPLGRRAPVAMLDKLYAILKRLVRFLAACERPLINQNLIIFEVYILFEHEMHRARVRRDSRTSTAAGGRAPAPTTARSAGSGDSDVLEPLFVFPHARHHSDTLVQRAQKEQRGPFKLSTLQERLSSKQSNSAAKRARAWFAGPRPREQGGLASDPMRERGDEFQTLPARLYEPRQGLDVFSASRATSDDEQAFGDSNKDARSDAPRTSAAGRESGATLGSAPATKRPVSAVFSNRSEDASVRSSRRRGRQNQYGLNEDPLSADARIVWHTWRCLFLVKRHLALYGAGRLTMSEARKKNCAALKQLSRHMKSLRRITTQPLASEMTFDELMSKAEQRKQPATEGGEFGPASPSTAAAENLRRMVYIVHVDDLLLLYNPHTGRRHVQRLGRGAPANERDVSSGTGSTPIGSLSSPMLDLLRSLAIGAHDGQNRASVRRRLQLMTDMGVATIQLPQNFFANVRDCVPLQRPQTPAASAGGVDPSAITTTSSTTECPVVLACSKNVQLLPWECMAGDATQVVRVLCVLSLMASLNDRQDGSGTGTQLPEILTCGRLGHGGPSRANEILRKQAVVRHSLGQLNSSGRSDTTLAPATRKNRSKADRESRPPNSDGAAAAAVWPFCSPLLPNGSRSSALQHSLRFPKLRQQMTVLDMSQQDANPFTILTWLENNSTSRRRADSGARPFPVFVFCLADLYQFCDAILCLLACRPDCALMFLPAACALPIVRDLLGQRDARDADAPRSGLLFRFAAKMRAKYGAPVITFSTR